MQDHSRPQLAKISKYFTIIHYSNPISVILKGVQKRKTTDYDYDYPHEWREAVITVIREHLWENTNKGAGRDRGVQYGSLSETFFKCFFGL